MKKTVSDRSMSAMSITTLILRMLPLTTGGAYLVNHFLTARAYRTKWRDYEDCGMM